jgi:EAL domain-containing protein (putative c-di-GMP-specific phosphodiesterase class I)
METSAIQSSGADPQMMVFEITETALVSDHLAARGFVEGLHQLGCKLALDDFGTGYGGFTCLRQLPIDYLCASPMTTSVLKDPEEAVARAIKFAQDPARLETVRRRAR